MVTVHGSADGTDQRIFGLADLDFCFTRLPCSGDAHLLDDVRRPDYSQNCLLAGWVHICPGTGLPSRRTDGIITALGSGALPEA